MFSTTCQYAIRAVLFLATHTGENEKVGVDILSEKLEIPKHFLAKILQQLTRSKLVSSSKGRNGGFYLSDKNKNSNLYEVIQTIDGPDKFDSCVLGLKECSGLKPCPYHEYVFEFRNRFYDKLKNETIAESANRIKGNFLSLN